MLLYYIRSLHTFIEYGHFFRSSAFVDQGRVEIILDILISYRQIYLIN